MTHEHNISDDLKQIIRYIVDAKSFLGVYGLDLRKSLKVSYEGYDKDFEELLKSLAIAS